MNDRDELLELILRIREEVAALDVDIAATLTEIRAAEEQLQALLRDLSPEDSEVATLEEQLGVLRGRAQDLQMKRAEVVSLLHEQLTNLTDLSPDLVDEVAQLDVGVPIVLLPVRIETRFNQSPPQLLVRIYPDRIHVDSHESELTPEELLAGTEYWDRAAADGESLDEWQKLLARYSATRAAWIVAATDPNDPGLNQLRPSSWSRAAEARLLPDRWLVLGYRDGNEVMRALSLPVVEPLALTVSPTAPDDLVADLSGDGMLVDTAIIWAYDFDRAIDSGMALRIDIAPEDLAEGFDLVVALGIKASMDPETGSLGLAELFAGHRFTEGMAFIPPGTPTNNTTAAPSGYPPADRDGAFSFTTERNPEAIDTGMYGWWFDFAFGLPPTSNQRPTAVWDVSRIPNATLHDEPGVKAMNNALWPATIGYFLDQIMEPNFPRSQIDAVREWVVEHVRGRGLLPAFRVGQTPYGILPNVALSRWQPSSSGDPIDIQVANLANLVRPIWIDKTPQVPRVGGTGDPDADLLSFLAMDASAREVRVRPLIGEYTHFNLVDFFGAQTFGLDWNQWIASRNRVIADLMTRIGRPSWNPRGGKLIFSYEHFRYSGPLVDDPPLSEDQPLTFNYIAWLLEGGGFNPFLLRDLEEAFPNQDELPDALLFYLLRHALLQEFNRSAMLASASHGAAGQADLRERELIQLVPGTEGDPTIWDRLDNPLPPLTGSDRLGSWLVNNPGTPETAWLDRFRESLAWLAGIPTAELERLFTETLDVCSHRLDAWISALAAKRLRELRDNRSEGSYIGAYGWVEQVRPVSPDLVSEMTLPDGRPTRVLATNGGNVHAPTIDHASAAAILRSAYLSRDGAVSGQFAVNLSSERVRSARRLLDSVRLGQPLGAVLGYHFERGLHERGLDIYIDPFRSRYPLVADKGSDSGEPADQIAARNVVDGLLLHADWRESGIPWGDIDATVTGPSGAHGMIEEELLRIDRMLDATADLLTAESAYQAMRGNSSAAGSSFDALAGGSRPPDPEIARAARGGTPLTHRVVLVFGNQPITPPGGWKTSQLPSGAWTETSRAKAEPQLAGWVGELIGNPTMVKALVSFTTSESGQPQSEELEVTLADLKLSPLDVLVLGDEATDANDLDHRIADVVFQNDAGATDVVINYSRDVLTNPQTVRSFPEILELARAIRAVLGGSRPLRPEDLVPPEFAASAEPVVGDGTDEQTRALAALDALKKMISDLENAHEQAGGQPDAVKLAALRDQLRLAASFGGPGTFPSPPLDDLNQEQDALRARAENVLRELGRRRDEADSITLESGRSALVEAATAVANAVFGRDLVLLPVFGAPSESELGLALNGGPSLAGKPSEIREWFQRAAHVQPGLARWRKLSLYTHALGTPNTPLVSFDLAQLPHDPAVIRWAALPFVSEAERPPPGRISLLLHRPNPSDPGTSWSGLLLDAWTEYIPYLAEQTGIAYHYDMPSAEAPQAILLAVPPDPGGAWELDTLIDTILETLELAKIRAVDGDLLFELAQLLPAIYLTANTDREAVDTDFTGKLVAEPVIVS